MNTSMRVVAPGWFRWIVFISTLTIMDNFSIAQLNDSSLLAFHTPEHEFVTSNVPEGYVNSNNVTAYAFFNEEDKLQYKVTWGNWEDIGDQEYMIEVSLISIGNVHCYTGFHNLQVEEFVGGDVHEICIPANEDASGFKLIGNCTYSIVVRKGNGSAETITDTIPVCIDGKCDCQVVQPSMDLFSEYLDADLYNVQWNFSTDAYINNITDISFHELLCDCIHCEAQHMGNDVESSSTNIQANQAVVNIAFQSNSFCLLVIFQNSYGCSTSRKIPIERVYRESWLKTSYTVLLVSVLIIIILFWYFDRCRGRIKALIITVALNRRARRNSYIHTNQVSTRLMETNIAYIDQEILEGRTDSFELPRNHLKILNEIGKGAFGEVYLGKAIVKREEIFVAVKTLRASSTEEKEDFLAEIKIMKKIGIHPNIVTMHKCCTLAEPYMMVMEYLPFGDLKHYLTDLRNAWNHRRTTTEHLINSDGSAAYISPDTPLTPTSPISNITIKSSATQFTNLSVTPISLRNFTFDAESALDHKELQSFALQIARGMAHLEKIPITHRDLAARNILINNEKNLKISDFGLSRAGPYVNCGQKKLPCRWLAVEVLEGRVHDSKSDVWSFAVVLWEIGTLGAFPYNNVQNENLLSHLHMGNRLTRPEICTDDLYTLMMRCWSAESYLRPSFEELVNQLETKVYMDISQLNPLYVFPPTSQTIQSVQIQRAETTPKYIEFP